MKKLVSYLIAAMMVFTMMPGTVFATTGDQGADAVYSGKCGDNVTWKVEDGTLTISGTGEMYDYYNDEPEPPSWCSSYAPWQKYRSQITQLIIENGITEIGAAAFTNMTNLTGKLVIPESVTAINRAAFSNCRSITDLSIPESVTFIGNAAFMYCKGLSGEIDLPDELTVLEKYSFYDCDNISGELFLNIGIEKVFCSAFEGCDNLDYVIFENPETDISVDELNNENPVFVGFRDSSSHKTAELFKHKFLFYCEYMDSHKLDIEYERMESTCIDAGQDAYWECVECGRIFGDSSGITELMEIPVILPTNNHKWSKWEVENEANCGDDGNLLRMCLDCDAWESKKVLASGDHKWTDWTGEKATCVNKGWKSRVCRVCNKIETIDYPETKTHNWTKWNWYNVDAPCANREASRECLDCGKAEHQFIKATAKHKWKNWVVDIEPTKTKQGLKHRECKACVYVQEVKIPAGMNAHNWVLSRAEPRASFDKNGRIKETCINRNCKKVRYRTVYRIKSATLEKKLYTYTGKVVKPTVIAKDIKGNNMKAGTDYKVTVKNLNGKEVKNPVNVGKYKAIIKFKSRYKGSVERTYVITPKSTYISNLVTGDNAFTITWQKRTAQVTGYEIQYSTTKNFTKKTTKTLKVKNFKTNVKTIKQLKAKKKYWVKIRTYKNVNGKLYYSTWSKVRTIITK